ncbi:MAG: 16S rRNA (uracil(1498)-N(3))-methyltransferase [Chloroflexi bacterium]|nr:16S rRNA (uracil(1498)-N(3))-methyltransferase [Chloroflexota bacterium]
MHRFFAPVVDGFAQLNAAQLHQIRRVLRIREGEPIGIFDGSGLEWLARLSDGDIEIERPLMDAVEPRTQLTLFQAVIKAPKFELVLQKCTELGVTRFVPFRAERSVALTDKPERWRSILIEAAEQSGRRMVPEISPVLSFTEALGEATQRGVPFLAWEQAERPKLASVHRPARDLALIIGPEGGFTEAEVGSARNRGAAVVSLGRRVLRSETAAIAASALLLHLNGEL